MAKKQASVTTRTGNARTATAPAFPYTTKPASLRRLLKEIPKKPRPAKFNKDLLRSWGFSDSNDLTMLRVLKAVGLLTEGNEPTELYSQFMRIDGGAKAIGPGIKRLYAPLFQASHTPYSESNEALKNLFNIHSGGGDRALDAQIQTFKALCENASFDSVQTPTGVSAGSQESGALERAGSSGVGGTTGPAVNINLHIHLPENKSRRDYEDIIEDIGRYIFGRSTGDRRER